MIIEYNNNMGSVDRCDQLMSYYWLNRNSRKWWVKVFFRFFRLMEMAVVKSFFLFKVKYHEFERKKSAH